MSLSSIARTSGVHRRTLQHWARGHAAQDAIVDRFAVNVGQPSLYYACQSVPSAYRSRPEVDRSAYRSRPNVDRIVHQ